MKKSVLIFIFVIFLTSLVTAGELRVTQEHPFLINGEWTKASELQIGDELTTIKGEKVRVTNIKDINLINPIDVYNIDSLEFDNFVLGGGVVVHNSDVPVEEICEEVTPPKFKSYDPIRNKELLNGIYIFRTGEETKPILDAINQMKQLRVATEADVEEFIAQERAKGIEPDEIDIQEFKDRIITPTDESIINGLQLRFPDKDYDEVIDLYIRYKEFEGMKQEYLDSNQALAYTLWKRAGTGKALTYEEGMEAANLAMGLSFDKYNPTLGYEFSTYAGQQVKWEVYRAIVFKNFGVQHLASFYYQYFDAIDDFVLRMGRRPNSLEELRNDFIENFKNKNNRVPTDDELEEILPKIKESVWNNIFCRYEQIRNPELSLDKPYEDGDVPVREDIRAVMPEQDMICHEIHDNLNDVLNSDGLSKKYARLLRLRYLDYTLEETAILLGMYEGGYSQEATKFALERYRAYLKESGGRLKEVGATRMIYENVKSDVVNEFGGSPEFLTRERIRGIQSEAEAILRALLIWKEIENKILLENQLFLNNEHSVLGDAGRSENRRKAISLYWGLAKVENNKIVYLDKPGRRYSVEEIQEILKMNEDYVRRNFKGAIDSLNEKYKWSLYDPEVYGQKFKNPDWSSLNDNPSLCQPDFKPEVISEVPVEPISDYVPSELESRIMEAKGLLPEAGRENSRLTIWVLDALYDDIVIYKRKDAFGNVYEKRAVILGKGDVGPKVVLGEAIIYDTGRQSLVIKKDGKYKYLNPPYNRERSLSDGNSVYFNSKTGDFKIYDKESERFLTEEELNVKFFDPNLRTVYIEMNGENYFFSEGRLRIVNVKGTTSQGIAEVGRILINGEKALINLEALQSPSTDFHIVDIKLRSNINGDDIIIFKNPYTGRDMIGYVKHSLNEGIGRGSSFSQINIVNPNVSPKSLIDSEGNEWVLVPDWKNSGGIYELKENINTKNPPSTIINNLKNLFTNQ